MQCMGFFFCQISHFLHVCRRSGNETHAYFFTYAIAVICACIRNFHWPCNSFRMTYPLHFCMTQSSIKVMNFLNNSLLSMRKHITHMVLLLKISRWGQLNYKFDSGAHKAVSHTLIAAIFLYRKFTEKQLQNAGFLHFNSASHIRFSDGESWVADNTLEEHMEETKKGPQRWSDVRNGHTQ